MYNNSPYSFVGIHPIILFIEKKKLLTRAINDYPISLSPQHTLLEVPLLIPRIITGIMEQLDIGTIVITSIKDIKHLILAVH